MESDTMPPESVLGTIGVRCDKQSNTITQTNPSIHLPSISLGGSMATSNSSYKPSAEQSMRLSPRPGRKLRLAADEGERLRATSPHSPRRPRTSKSPNRDITLGQISDSPPRPPRRLKYKSSSLEDELPSHVKGTFTSSLTTYPLQLRTNNNPHVPIPKIVSSDDSHKPGRLRVKPGDLRSRSMTRLDTSSPLSSPKPPRSPRLGKTLSWSTDSEEDSPRSTKPLPPVSSSPKKVWESNDKLVDHGEEKQRSKVSSGRKSSQPSPNTSPRSILRKSAPIELEGSPESERGKIERKSRKEHSSQRTHSRMRQTQPSLSGASDNDDDENDVFPIPSPFSLPERARLPDTSSIFQQALSSLNSRQSSLSSDPGDLHVRRSSLVNSFINLTDSNSATTPSSDGIDCLFGNMSTVSENDNNTDNELRLTTSVFLKVSKWTGKTRKISAPSTLMTVDQAPLSSPPTPTPSKHRVVAEIHPPRRELLEGVDNPRPKTSTDSMSESSEATSNSSQNYVTEIPRPLISKRAMNYIMNFISKATVSDAAAGISTKLTAHQPGREGAMFPVIQNSISARRARDRRDSLRAIRHFISGENTKGDTTEITSFDDLRSCRYIRDFKPTGKEARNAKHTTYHEW